MAALVARSFAGDAVVGALATTEAVKPAAEAAWSISTSLLDEAASATIAYGVVLIGAAWLAGPTAWATAIRRTLAPYLREPRLAYGALALIALILLAWGPTPALRRAIPALALLALLALGVEVLRRQTAREFPDTSRHESLQRVRERVAGIGRRVRGESHTRRMCAGTKPTEWTAWSSSSGSADCARPAYSTGRSSSVRKPGSSARRPPSGRGSPGVTPA